MKISPARTSAFDVLKRIETERAYSSVLLPEYEIDLSEKDRSLCHQLVMGVLRRQLYLDQLIDHFSNGKKLDLAVRIALRLGLYQLKYLDRIPAHSAVNESVNLVQRAKKTSARGFVNALLRRSLREEFLPTCENDLERISIETSHPIWLIRKWADEFGPERAALVAAANNAAPKLAFRSTARSAAGRSYQGTVRSETVSTAIVADGFSAELAEAAASGEIYFQDEGSQLVASLIDLNGRGSFLDVCAAPGSKVTEAATRYRDDRKLIVAGDLHRTRLDFLKKNCQRQGVENVSVVQYDANDLLPFADGAFDVVLVDAPCSGTGTIRSNPEIRYSLTNEDISSLSLKQRGILKNASKAVSSGGILLYSTCSLEREENEEVADEFLSSDPGFAKSQIKLASKWITEQGYARTYPDRDKCDGFFIAVFQRL